MSQDLFIVGASARSAAQSACRAGLAPWAADLFADADLRACCAGVRVHHYPEEFLQLVRAAPPGPWMYTGALENYPDLVDRLAAERTLFGNSGEYLRQVRDPFALSAAALAHGLPFPETRRPSDLPPPLAGWLCKAFRATGGTGVCEASEPTRAAADPAKHYFQRRIDGLPCSAVYVAARRRATLLGATRQLIGTGWTGACGFHYSGSIGPLPLAENVTATLGRLGEVIAAQFDLLGLFGVDFILAGDTVWPLEVNPRYTASVEILERSLGVHALAMHIAACRDGHLPVPPGPVPIQPCGKAILYARQDLTVPRSVTTSWQRENAGTAWPQKADIPHPGATIPQGGPITTVFAAGSDLGIVVRHLRRHVAAAEKHLNADASCQES